MKLEKKHRQYIEKHKDMNYKELTKKLNRTFGTDFSYPYIAREAKKYNGRKLEKRVHDCIGMQDPSACVFCPYSDCLAYEQYMTDDLVMRDILTDIFAKE